MWEGFDGGLGEAAREAVQMKQPGCPALGCWLLSDQFGWTYAMSEGTSNGLTGDLTVQFQPLAWPDPITGARITLRVSSVQTLTCNGTGKDATCNEGQPLSGSWTLPAILGVDETTALPLPATARLGPATYRFTSVRASAARPQAMGRETTATAKRS